MILRASPQDGAEYRLRNRKGPCAHGQEEFAARPRGLFASAWAMLRFVMHRRLFGTRRPTAPLAEWQEEVSVPDAMSVPQEGERASVRRVQPVGARGPLNFRR